MADDKTVIQLIVEGAQQAVRQILSVSQSQTDLARVQEQAAQSQVRSYDQITRAAQAAADAQVEAAKRASAAQEAAAKVTVDAAGRARDVRTGRFVRQGEGIVAQRGQQEALRAGFQIASLGGLNARIAAAVQPPIVQPQAQQNTAQLAAGLRQLAQAAQQAATAQDLTTKAGQRLAAQMLQVASQANKQADALANVTNASSRAGSQGLTYLSVLSAIHAASFLSTNQTFSMVGSFVTLGLAFGKLGAAASAAGLVLGGLLAIFGQISKGIETIQQVTIQGATALAGFAGAVGAAAIAASGASVKLAADVESQLAAVRAFGGATNTELRQVAAQAEELGARFGVATADVVQATSLFARAGGTVKQAIDGATEAIIKLQVASQGELDAAQAAIVISAALKQFSLDGAEAGRVADNLAAAAQNSALSFVGVQQAFVQAAPGAAALGISIEDLSAAIALIGDRLVKGTITGTAFKQAILDVINPTKAAQEIFDKAGISVKDLNGNVLPLINIVGQLNQAFGKMVDAEGNVIRQQDAATIAALGGARAFLAFNILTERGAAGLEEYQAALAKTTTSNIVDVLLLPLNKQLERLPVVAQQAGAAFGGPLLEPARQAVLGIIGFLQQLKPALELAGQAVRTVLVGQGFEALQVAIDNLVGHNALSSFLIELVNSFRNVRDVIVSQIVPAVTTFLQTIGAIGEEPGRLDSIGSAFEGINTKIQQVGAAAATAIVSFGNLITEFVNAEGAGGRLRTTIEGLARALLTQLAASLSTMVITLQAAITAMPAFARLALLSAQAAASLARAVSPVADAFDALGTSIRRNELLEEQKALIEAGQGESAAAASVRAELASLEAGRARSKQGLAEQSAANEKLVSDIQTLLPQIELLGKSFEGVGQVSAETARLAKISIQELVNELISAEAEAQGIDPTAFTPLDLQEFENQAIRLKAAAKANSVGLANPFIQVFEDAQGQLGTIFDNITADIERRSRDIASAGSGAAGAGPRGLDQKELDKIKARIAEAGSDISRRLENLAQDSAQRVANLIARALERLDDIKQNALQRIDDITEATNDRIAESQRAVRERREDRQELDNFKKNQEDEFTVFQRGLDRQAQADQRALEDRQRLRQQDNEDFARSTEQQFQDEATLQDRRLAVVQRAFDMMQQARATAFDRAQSVELTAFQRSQQAAAEARQFTLSLANAKTPEEKANLTKQRNQQLQDTRFQQSQEDALTKFRQQQEDKKLRFSQQQETEAIGFRQGLEDRLTAFRRLQETQLIKFRRGEEAKELGLRRQEEDELLQHRLANEDIITARRRQDALDLQTLQDQIENKRNAEEEGRVRAKALQEINKAIATAQKQAQEVEDKLLLDLAEQAAEVAKQARNIVQVLIDLQTQVPPELFAPYVQALQAAREQAEGVETALAGAQENAKLQIAQRSALNQAELITAQQRAAAALAAPATMPTQTAVPGQVVSLQTLQVANLVTSATFNQDVANGVVLGFQLLIDRGLIPGEISIDTMVPITDVLNDIRRELRG